MGGVCYDEIPMEINVLFDDEFEECLDPSRLANIAATALDAGEVGDNAEMELLITGQERIQELNKTYRQQDRPTDVLSFALSEDDEDGLPFADAPDGLRHLGQVVISYPQAQKQAAERGHPVDKEVAVLVIHGVLHLLGYDHIQDEDAELMEACEAQILETIEADTA
jgi:probable rRNA maturation factor